MTSNDRHDLAKKRILSVTNRHGAIYARTMEQKIADGGPYNQRLNPHIITPARNALLKHGELITIASHGVDWFATAETPNEIIEKRIKEQGDLHIAATNNNLSKRVGQALEIAFERALIESPLEYIGHYNDLNSHDDSTLYSKEEPTSSLNGYHIPGKKKLDFLVRGDVWGGVEIKNTRAWIYPNNVYVKDLLLKCAKLDIVPILVARRIPYVTNMLLRTCGGITWETLRQRYPETEFELVQKLRNKELLGFSDLSLGNHADAPLCNFVREIIPRTLLEQRERYDAFKDLLEAFATETMSYEEFAARVRRRTAGTPEDADPGWEDIPF